MRLQLAALYILVMFSTDGTYPNLVSQLIGFDLKRYNQMMSVEVNDFRHRMKVFAIQRAQERRERL